MTQFTRDTCRALMLGTLMLGGLVTGASAAEPASEEVATAVEKLRVAMLDGDGSTIRKLISPELSYGHSSGVVQSETEFLKDLEGKHAFKSLAQSQQTVKVVGENAIVRHVFDSENNLADGKTSLSHIGVLQVWHNGKAGWQLLARQAVPLPKQ